MTDVSVLIPAKNEALNIRSCLDGIFSQATDAEFEVILVDSGSVDGTPEIASEYPVRLYRIPPEEFHHARTRNYLAELAHGRHLVYLNADAFPASPSWLSSLLANFSDSTVGAAYGRHLPKAGSNLEREIALAALYGEMRIVKEPSRKRELGYRYYLFSTVNAAIRKEVWQATRFPEDLKIFEDLGIAKRILDGGWKIVYEPSAVVRHSENLSPTELFKRYFDIGVVFKRLEMWNENNSSSLLRDGWNLMRKKLTQRGTNGTRGPRFGSIIQDGAKYAGIMLGKNEGRLPLTLKRKLSSVRIFD